MLSYMCTINEDCTTYGSWNIRCDRDFCHFGLFFALTPPPTNNLENQNLEKSLKNICVDIIMLYIYVYYKWRSCDIWFLKYNVWQTEILSFWAIFCFFKPLTTQKIKILKLKKTPGYIIIVHIHTINNNHMIYSFWYMERSR